MKSYLCICLSGATGNLYATKQSNGYLACLSINQLRMHKYTSQVKSKQASSAYSRASPITCVNLVSVKFAKLSVHSVFFDNRTV